MKPKTVLLAYLRARDDIQSLKISRAFQQGAAGYIASRATGYNTLYGRRQRQASRFLLWLLEWFDTTEAQALEIIDHMWRGYV